MTDGEHTILIDGLRFHFRVQGCGADVVLMHGWGCSTDIWRGVEAELAQHFRVWNIDFPGFGQSQMPTEPWGVEEYTRNFEQFCQMNSISRPTLIGHSFGGRVAIVFASRNEVDKMVLVDAAGVLPPRGLKYYAKVYSYKAMKMLAPLLLGKERGQRLIEQRRRASGSSDYNALPETMRGTFIRVVNQDLCPYMPQIKAPTLLVWGSEDTATPLSDARVMNSLIDDSGLVVFDGVGHYSFLEQPVRFNIVVSNFLGVDKLVR
ncbi:MAG: alpha/beta hydrolase [Rikenellaceae bacterium]|nr:alpha/beta hydrolase [Rikenellaceae bacterium]